MVRVTTILCLLFVCLFTVSTSGTPDNKKGYPNEKCNNENHFGQIEILIDDLPEVPDPDHEAICVYRSKQNSILWSTKKYKAFHILLEPIDPVDAPHPFERPASEFYSVDKYLSSGLPKKVEIEAKRMYKMTIEVLNHEGGEVEKVLDPHIKV